MDDANLAEALSEVQFSLAGKLMQKVKRLQSKFQNNSSGNKLR
jgi:hypothetical protein